MIRLQHLLLFVITSVTLFLLLVTIPSDQQPEILHNFLKQVEKQAHVNLSTVYWQDKRNEPDLFDMLAPDMPNLPLQFLHANKEKQRKMNDTCAKLPNLYDLHFNTYWQIYESNDGTYNLYSAFLDVREQNSYGPIVRILTMVDSISPSTNDSFCQLWFNETTEPVFSKVTNYNLIFGIGNTLPRVR